MESEVNFLSKKERPPVLFHASINNDIETFEPRAQTIRDKQEGPQVFASPSRAVAGFFLIENDDSWVQHGAFDGVPYIIISDEERFRNSDKGGTVYSLPSSTFQSDPSKGLGDLEWTSNVPVTPIGKEFVPSAIQDMLRNGVRIYFVDKVTYRKIRDSVDHGYSIIEGLVPASS